MHFKRDAIRKNVIKIIYVVFITTNSVYHYYLQRIR